MYEALLLASALLFLGTAVAFALTRQAALYHPATLYLGFHGFVFVLRPILAHAWGFDFIYELYDFRPSRDEKITVILGANLAMLVFVAGTVLLNRSAQPAKAHDDWEAARRRLTMPVIATALLIGPFAIAAQLSNWGQRAQLFDTMVRDGATGTLVNTTGIGWFSDLGLALAPLAVLLVWLNRYRLPGWLAFGGFAVLQAGTGVRGPLVVAVLAIAFVYLMERGARWPRRQTIVLGLFAAFAFNQIVMDRGSSVRQVFVEESQSRIANFRNLDPLEDMDFANLEYFEFIVHTVPNRTGSWDYFAHNLQILTEPVPRALWKDKPVGSPVQFFSLWNHGRPIGITLTVPGIGWMSLGYPGIAIQAMIFALIYGLLYRFLFVRSNLAPARLVYAMIAAASVIAFRDGALIAIVRTLPFYIGPFVLAFAIAKLFPPKRTRATQNAADPLPTPAHRRSHLIQRAD